MEVFAPCQRLMGVLGRGVDAVWMFGMVGGGVCPMSEVDGSVGERCGCRVDVRNGRWRCLPHVRG